MPYVMNCPRCGRKIGIIRKTPKSRKIIVDYPGGVYSAKYYPEVITAKGEIRKLNPERTCAVFGYLRHKCQGVGKHGTNAKTRNSKSNRFNQRAPAFERSYLERFAQTAREL